MKVPPGSDSFLVGADRGSFFILFLTGGSNDPGGSNLCGLESGQVHQDKILGAPSSLEIQPSIVAGNFYADPIGLSGDFRFHFSSISIPNIVTTELRLENVPVQYEINARVYGSEVKSPFETSDDFILEIRTRGFGRADLMFWGDGWDAD
jgi:hypothetical protein